MINSEEKRQADKEAVFAFFKLMRETMIPANITEAFSDMGFKVVNVDTANTLTITQDKETKVWLVKGGGVPGLTIVSSSLEVCLREIIPEWKKVAKKNNIPCPEFGVAEDITHVLINRLKTSLYPE
jgi:hypothetical protein